MGLLHEPGPLGERGTVDLLVVADGTDLGVQRQRHAESVEGRPEIRRRRRDADDDHAPACSSTAAWDVATTRSSTAAARPWSMLAAAASRPAGRSEAAPATTRAA